ncbi:N-acetyl-gamma-glutamyl-phosphate reductase [Alicyclobacillus acidiphilus]|uniref:N-acetyl-gamma-glutamyl-phosphate reductase n=1 Tax=Alicyclobacillus acidiphilus TaxID=182455 RepID=UPI00082FC14F|nr:N-acetyl-gamma-glutamyl-phosphate reductase [Alicyclobacillus acidiphilus]
MQERPIRVGIIGPTGYAGMELIRIVIGHPHLELTYLAGSGNHSGTLAEVFPHFAHVAGPDIVTFDADVCAQACDLAFVALPSGESGKVAVELWRRGVRTVDLSGDLRLPSDVYQTWYGKEPLPDDVIQEAVYGLSEFNRSRIAAANLISNPGCYATAAILALKPIVSWSEARIQGPVAIDAKSGVTGAGRGLKSHLLFAELANDFYPYRVGSHQHTPEIEQALSHECTVLLTTQLLPVMRGILTSSYVTLSGDVRAEEIQGHYESFYQDEPFVHVLPYGQVPHMKSVVGTNHVQIGVHLNERTGILQVFSVIDNLGKGASGQAVQNVNIAYGFAETTGLTQEALWT